MSKPRLSGQHDVEQDTSNWGGRDRGKHPVTVVDGHYGKAVEFEKVPDQSDDLAVILNDQNGSIGHAEHTGARAHQRAWG